MCQAKPGVRCKSHLEQKVFEASYSAGTADNDADVQQAYRDHDTAALRYIGSLKEKELEAFADEAEVYPKWVKSIHKNESTLRAWHKDQAAKFVAEHPNATLEQRKKFAEKIDNATAQMRKKYQENLRAPESGITNGVQIARAGGAIQERYLSKVQERKVLTNPDRGVRYTKPGTDVLHRVDGPAAEYPNGDVAYYRDGQLHRDEKEGPARILADGRQEYYKKGVLHRTNGPAVIRENGTQDYYKNGVKHRNEKDGPAVIYGSGRGEEYWKNGEMHRDNGPAFTLGEKGDAERRWFRNGKLHRTDGPAIEHDNGDYSYYENDEMHRDLQDGPASTFGVNTEHWVRGVRVHHPDDWDMKFDPSKAKFGPFDADGKRNYEYYE